MVEAYTTKAAFVVQEAWRAVAADTTLVYPSYAAACPAASG